MVSSVIAINRVDVVDLVVDLVDDDLAVDLVDVVSVFRLYFYFLASWPLAVFEVFGPWLYFFVGPRLH